MSGIDSPAAMRGLPTRLGRLVTAYRGSLLLRVSLELALLLGLVLALDAFQTRGHVRGPLPELTLHDLQGDSVRLASLYGQPILLVVWAPWCGVCKLEAANVARARRWLEPRARVISVAASYRSVDEVRAFVRDHEMDYPVLLGDRNFQYLFNVQAFPTSFVLDSSGNIVRSTQGYTSTFGLWWRTAL